MILYSYTEWGNVEMTGSTRYYGKAGIFNIGSTQPIVLHEQERKFLGSS
jgi:hypothetical protein